MVGTDGFGDQEFGLSRFGVDTRLGDIEVSDLLENEITASDALEYSITVSDESE